MVGRIFNRAIEVIRAVKPPRESGDNCPWYGKDANPWIRLLQYLKTTFWLSHDQKLCYTDSKPRTFRLKYDVVDALSHLDWRY